MPRQIIRKDGRVHTLKDNKNRFYFPEEFEEILKHLRPKTKFYVNFLLNTGARINEARHVKVEDINLDDKWIILRKTKAKAKKGETKGRGNPRYISISTQFAKYLKNYIKKKGLSITHSMPIPSTPAVNEVLKNSAKKAGIKDWHDFSAHTLRKTLETWLMALDVNDMKICKHIGHDIKTAVSNYVSPDIFNMKQKFMMRQFIGDLYERK